MSSQQGPPNVGITPQAGKQHSVNRQAASDQLKRETRDAARDATAARGAGLTPATDTLNKMVGFETGFQDTAQILIGVIIDGVATANCYRVQVEKAVAPVLATPLTHNSQTALGASSISTYAPGTAVILAVHHRAEVAYILGAMPAMVTTARDAWHDYITPASRKRVDDCHKKYLRQALGGQIMNCNGWRPFDATHGSEWGAIASTGLKITLDNFMVQLAVNEICGIFGFYHDSMLRIAAYNLQVWTAGHEREAIMDQNEYNDYQGYNPYPWEAAGLLEPGQETVIEVPPAAYQGMRARRPYYAHWENKHEFQQPFHRTQEFFGYLGQGKRSVVQVPPKGIPRWTYDGKRGGFPGPAFDSGISGPSSTNGPDKEYDHKEEPYPWQLHEDNVALDGRRFIASAKGIVLTKRLLLPAPIRKQKPESGAGDDAEINYKASGKDGSGPDHEITGDLKITAGGKYPWLQRALGVLELHGYLFNYAGLHAFHWHSKDYFTPEQSKIGQVNAGKKLYNQRLIDYGAVCGSMYLPPPPPIKIRVDHRYEEQDYFETESYLSLLDDGSIALCDGFGCEIRMLGGSLIFSAPRDIWLKSGRHIQQWSGCDNITRAYGTVDISTTKKNIRIKSEQNVLILAGNENAEKPGGVLIESRAKSPIYDFTKCGDDVLFGGVVLKAKDAEVIGLAQNIYMRTVNGSEGDGKPPGNITLDASRGEGTIATKSSNLFHYVGEFGKIFHCFRTQADENTDITNYFAKDFTLLAGPLGVPTGPIIAAGRQYGVSFLATGHIITNKGGVFSEDGGMLIPCQGDCKADVGQIIETLEDYVTNLIPDLVDQVDEQYFDKLYYEEKRPGNWDTIDYMEFSFRNDDQYKIDDFLIFEDKWQQLARIGGIDTPKWTETPIENKACGEPTFPYPGKKWLTEEPAFAEVDYQKGDSIVEFDGTGFSDKDRQSNKDPADLDSAYRDPKFTVDFSERLKIINGNYPTGCCPGV